MLHEVCTFSILNVYFLSYLRAVTETGAGKGRNGKKNKFCSRQMRYFSIRRIKKEQISFWHLFAETSCGAVIGNPQKVPGHDQEDD